MLGKTLGHYEILDKLGTGGMGEVYRAQDTKLRRDVALKLLPPEFAADTSRMARFQTEARALAALNHTNVSGIFGIEHHEDRRILVMELAEGEDLSDRIARGLTCPHLWCHIPDWDAIEMDGPGAASGADGRQPKELCGRHVGLDPRGQVGVGHHPHICTEQAHGIFLTSSARVAVARQIDGDDPVTGRKVRQLLSPVAGDAAPAVDQDQGRRAVPVDLVGDGRTVGRGHNAKGSRTHSGGRGDGGQDEADNQAQKKGHLADVRPMKGRRECSTVC